MPRKLRDRAIDSRTSRLKLAAQREPYWKGIGRGLHLGYRRLSGGAGSWLVRAYIDGAYQFDRIGTADDLFDADGVTTLNFWQAVDAVRKRSTSGRSDGPVADLHLTVADVMAAYLDHLAAEGRAAHSIRDARCRIDAFILPSLGGLKANDLIADRLRRWRDDLTKLAPRLRTRKGDKQKHRMVEGDDAKRARRASVNRCWTILRAGLNFAFRAGRIKSDTPWRSVKPFRGVDAARVRYLTIADAKRLLNACDDDFRLLVRAALTTGARYGELIGLTAADYNPDVGTVAIRRSKSGKARHIVLTDEGRRFFADLTAGRPGNQPMLRRSNGTTWEKANARRPMLEAVARAKIKPAISFHGLRHTWASLSIMNGVPSMIVAKNLGHSDTRMVEKHYGHLAPSFIADAIRDGAPQFGFKSDRKLATLR